MRVPARNTVAHRIARLDPATTMRRREGQDASRELLGGFPDAEASSSMPQSDKLNARFCPNSAASPTGAINGVVIVW